MKRLALFLAATAAAGCVATVAPAPVTYSKMAPGAAGTVPPIGDEEINRLVDLVSVARQLPVQHTVAISRLDKRSFAARLGEGHASADDERGEQAYLLAFGFLPRGAKAAPSSSDIFAEQVVGFYDTRADRVFVTDAPPKTAEERREQRGVLAHEIQHALQAQHFGKPREPKSSDEALAELALFEGDAMVAMGAALGAEADAPVGRTLRRLQEVTKEVPLSKVTKGEGAPRALIDRAPAIMKKHLEFPYTEGMRFVADVYRAGGFPLVNTIYASPPKSTAEILHPERYLLGEGPRPVRDPAPPSGYRVATVDTLGELDTQMILERCLPREAAGRAAAGWRGDRYGVFVGPNDKLALAWTTALRTEDDAARFEAALARAPVCFGETASGGAPVEAGEHAAKRRGKIVAFVRGYPESGRDAALERLLGSVGAEPASVPRSSLKIPPALALPEPKHGHIRGDVYENEWLGVVGRVPVGMQAEIGHEFVDFSISRPGVLVHGGLAYSTRVTTKEGVEHLFAELEEEIRSAVKLPLSRIDEADASTPLGRGTARTFRIAGTPAEARAVLVPICAGTGAVVFFEVYADAYARQVLDGWVGSFRWSHGRDLIACNFLDPK